MNILLLLIVIACCLAAFAGLWVYFWLSHRTTLYAYFDAQDFTKYEQGGGRKLPVSAENGTFAPLLSHYIDLTKFLITIATASIALVRINPQTPGFTPPNSFCHSVSCTVSSSARSCSILMMNMDKTLHFTRGFSIPP